MTFGIFSGKIEKIAMRYHSDDYIKVYFTFKNLKILTPSSDGNVMDVYKLTNNINEKEILNIEFYIDKLGELTVSSTTSTNRLCAVKIESDENGKFFETSKRNFSKRSMFDIENFEVLIADSVNKYLKKITYSNVDELFDSCNKDPEEIKINEDIPKEFLNFKTVRKKGSKVIFKLDRKKIEHTRIRNSKKMKVIELDLLEILLNKSLEEKNKELFSAVVKRINEIKSKM